MLILSKVPLIFSFYTRRIAWNLIIIGEEVLFDSQFGAANLNDLPLTTRQFAWSCVVISCVCGGGLGGVALGVLVGRAVEGFTVDNDVPSFAMEATVETSVPLVAQDSLGMDGFVGF